jgi:hypothetical protein
VDKGLEQLKHSVHNQAHDPDSDRHHPDDAVSTVSHGKTMECGGKRAQSTKWMEKSKPSFCIYVDNLMDAALRTDAAAR